jgi:RNA polymerase subunit RPABC4/transcription elongation factor Spt4
MASTRDEFSRDVVRALQERAGNQCSSPSCQCLTSGPNHAKEKASRIGVAAHITAAAPGGPRYDTRLSSEERSSITNGIWLCQNCARLIDVDPVTYSTALLLNWRQAAEDYARREIEGGRGLRPLPDPDLAKQDGWGCPHCGTVVPDSHTVCLGCHAEVVYGSTREERENDIKTGLFFGGAGSALAVFALPSWLASEFAWSLLPGWGLGIYSAIPVVICSLVSGFAFSGHEDTRRRRQPPRFFRSSIA